MVASRNLFWGEECQYLMELGKDTDRLLFLSEQGSRSKEKTLALDRGEGRNVLCSFLGGLTESPGRERCSRADLLLTSVSANQKQQQLR